MPTPVEASQDRLSDEASSAPSASAAATGSQPGYEMEAMDEIIDAASGAKPGGGDAWGTTRESAEDIAKRIAALAGWFLFTFCPLFFFRFCPPGFLLSLLYLLNLFRLFLFMPFGCR